MTSYSSSAASGYVHGPFRIFHLTDIPDHEIPIHFHDFRKIVILIKGSLFYDIEGERYSLQSGDIVLVDAGEHHRPVLPRNTAGSMVSSEYDRIIIYLSDEYLASHADAGLDRCFRSLSDSRGGIFTAVSQSGIRSADSPDVSSDNRCAVLASRHVIRGTSLPQIFAGRLIPGLTEHFSEVPEIQQLMMTCRLTEFLLQLNRTLEEIPAEFPEPVTRNPAVRNLMQYLSDHLADSLNIETAAEVVHLDRSYLMHIFKAETGFSIMTYITEKRLFLAHSLLREGIPAAEACSLSGFTNYTSFYRAYRKRYGTSPRSTADLPPQVIHE